MTAGDSRWQGQTSDDYWALVGLFGGATAATVLRALIEHPERSGDPLSLTVNCRAPIAQGAFDLDDRLVKANCSSQHWCVELTRGGGEVTTLVTAVFAERRPSRSYQPAEFPTAKPFEQILPYPKIKASWANQYDFRFVEGPPDFSGAKNDALPASAFSKLWISDRASRKRSATPRSSTGATVTSTANCGRQTVACSRPPLRSRISRHEKGRLIEPPLRAFPIFRMLRLRSDPESGDYLRRDSGFGLSARPGMTLSLTPPRA